MPTTSPTTALLDRNDDPLCECIECGIAHCEPIDSCDSGSCCNDHGKTLEQVQAEDIAAELACARAWHRFERSHGGLFEALLALKNEHDAKADRDMGVL